MSYILFFITAVPVVTVTGIAPVAAICDPGQSVSLVEFTGFHSWSTAAHELGHK